MCIGFNEDNTAYMSYGPFTGTVAEPQYFYEGTWQIIPWEETPGPNSVVWLELKKTMGDTNAPSQIRSAQYVTASEYEDEAFILYYVDGDELIPNLGIRGIPIQRAMG